MASRASTLGILGGGQLGRMLALAARPLGYRVAVLDPDPRCAAAPVVERCITAPFDDAEAAAALGREATAITLEIEKIGLACIDAAAAFAPVRPGRAVLEVVQDRARQKQWLERHGLPVGRYRLARSADELARAVRDTGRSFVKACHGGYDGRSQLQLAPDGDAADAFASLGSGPCVVESALDLAAEISVLVTRRPAGEVAVYPPALNHHEKQILVWSVLPAELPRELPSSLPTQATALARAIAEALALEGLLAVEMFVTRAGELFVNELAPRPHNSYHASVQACVTGQFEQAVRATFDLPLGLTDIVRPAAIHNLLGDLWRDGEAPDLRLALALPGVGVHLYGKAEARPGRKMGHLYAVGASPKEAVARVQEAYRRLAQP